MYRVSLALALMGALHAQSTAPRVDPRPEKPHELLRSLRRHLEASRSAAATALHLEDFDGDGKLDVVLSAHAFAHLYRGLGDGLFEFESERLPEGVFGRLVAADFDVDGDVDLFGSLGFLLRNDRGRFTAELGAGPAITGPAIAADFDGDGDPDVLTRQSLNLLLLRGDGQGGFIPETGLALPAIPQHFAAGDVNGDGSLDLLIASDLTTHLALNDGSGGFVDASTGLPAQSLRTNALALFDLEGDGDLDAVLANEGVNALWVGNGTGSFTEPGGSYAPLALDTRGLAVLDANGDGRSDLYFANYAEVGFPMSAGAADRLLLNNGDGTFTDGSNGLPAWTHPSGLAVGADVDGDGDDDLLVASRQLRLLFGDGAGSFAHEDGGIPARWGSSSSVTLADINGDAYLDAIVGGGQDFAPRETSRIYLGDGTGRFTDDSIRLGPSPPSAQASALGDIDGDGDLDLVLAVPYDGDFISRSQDNHLYLNDGNGFFTDVSSTHLPVHVGDDRGVTQAVRLFDIDGDLDLDLFFGDLDDRDGGGGGVTFYEGDGTGHFTIPTGFGTGLFNTGTEAFDFDDIDGDGDADIVARLKLFGMTLIENQAGSFVDVGARLPRAHGFFHDIAWSEARDFNGDGNIDLVGAGSKSAGGPFVRVRFLLLGQGDGTFVDATAGLPAAALNFDGYAAADIDGDGDLDLVGAEHVLENNGAARFFDRGMRVDRPSSITGAAFADLDEDGDLDVFWAGTEQDAVGSNTTRHLAARGLARIGKPLVFEIFGTPRIPWRLATSPQRTRSNTVFGLLQLEASTLSWVAAGVVPESGRDQWSSIVPANPALVGTRQYWQAFTGSPATLTNLEAVVLTAW